MCCPVLFNLTQTVSPLAIAVISLMYLVFVHQHLIKILVKGILFRVNRVSLFFGKCYYSVLLFHSIFNKIPP